MTSPTLVPWIEAFAREQATTYGVRASEVYAFCKSLWDGGIPEQAIVAAVGTLMQAHQPGMSFEDVRQLFAVVSMRPQEK